jgi:hypothetical protein
MKHATASTLATLDPLLAELRALPGLVERKHGTFYRRSRAFLHFHEDPAGLFADARLDGSAFARLPVNTLQERRALVVAVRAALARLER